MSFGIESVVDGLVKFAITDDIPTEFEVKGVEQVLPVVKALDLSPSLRQGRIRGGMDLHIVGEMLMEGSMLGVDKERGILLVCGILGDASRICHGESRRKLTEIRKSVCRKLSSPFKFCQLRHILVQTKDGISIS